MAKNVISAWEQYHAIEGDNFELVYLSGEVIDFSKFIFNHVIESKSGEVTVLSSGRKDIPPYAPGKVAVAEIRINESGDLSRHLSKYIALPNDQWLELAEVRLTEVSGIEEWFRTRTEEIREELSAGEDVASGVAERVDDVATEVSERAKQVGGIGAIAVPIILAGLVGWKILDALG